MEALDSTWSKIEFQPYRESSPVSSCDLVVLNIAADRGISADEIKAFNELRERQIPAIILVSSLMPEDGIPLADDRWDFDDITMLITRTLEKPVAPYLVLHDDEGLPIGLYDLKGDCVINYSSDEGKIEESDQELKEVVRDFKTEFDEEDFTESDFTSGLRVVALPFIPERRIGVAEADRYLTTLLQVRS
jgi:hypothetical protein